MRLAHPSGAINGRDGQERREGLERLPSLPALPLPAYFFAVGTLSFFRFATTSSPDVAGLTL